MVFSYNWLKEYINGDLPKPDRLADLLSLRAFEVESVEKKDNDWALTISGKAFPHRPDAMSHLGLAREVAVITGRKLVLPKSSAIKKERGNAPHLSVKVQDSTLVPRYAALVIEGVSIKESPKWLKERLRTLGVNSLGNMVDLTNYIMLEMGQPLHAFDYDQIQGHQMVVGPAKEGEQVETLDEQVIGLPKGTLVIEDAKGIIDLAGIKGGKRSSISAQAKNIVLQAANFQAQTIHKARQELAYTTQAADLYAHGIDSNLCMEALSRAYYLLSEWGIGGKVIQTIDLYPKKITPTTIRLEHSYVESLLGISIPPRKVLSLLQQLGCEVHGTFVKPPTRRMDLQIPEDLVEEIGRLYGFEKIPSLQPLVSLSSPAKNYDLVWQEHVRDALVGAGFTEVYNYSFIGAGDLATFNYAQEEKAQLVALRNPVSSELAYMRDSLLENLLKKTATNQKLTSLPGGQAGQIRLFEIGKTFRKKSNGIEEIKMLGGVASGFYEAKGILDALFESLGISDVWYDEYQPTPEKSRRNLWNLARCAEIKIAGKEIGFLGEVSGQIAANLKLMVQPTMFQLNLESLSQLASEEKSYQASSRFPSSIRDIAILVPQHVKVADALNVINSAGGPLVADIDVFDIYQGEEVPEGKKNLAFHVIYQSNERTLEGKQIDELHQKIIQAVEENPEWEVRK